MNKCCILVAAALSSVTTFGFNLQGDVHAQRVVWPGRSVLTFTQDGTLTVSGSGTVDLLMVGGGGGGGKASDAEAHRGGGGGGAGGVIYKQSFAVSEGRYSVVIGQGGAENANGGDTKLFDDAQVLKLIAHGGGGGANGEAGAGKNGASGGGAAHPWSGSDVAAGGQAVFAADDNLGYDGGSASHPYGAGGGGGAGETPTVHVNGGGASWPMVGGNGLQYDICGTNVWYAGGGAGGSAFGVKANGGKGGGGKSGEAGAPGTGGGGGGGGDGHPAGSAGGSGILIVSFVPDVAADSDDFALTGGDQRVELSEDEVLVFTNSGPLSVSGSGRVEVLLVGGGGGGAGGVVHLEDVAVSPGVYQVTIGSGGEPNSNGGNTIAFGGLIAYGGGGGGNGGYTANTAKSGASGGGATFRIEGSGTYSGGKAIYLESANLGNDGGAASHMYGAGGGGGAGAPATVYPSGDQRPMHGGDGLQFDISGTSTWYAGGGAGGRAYGTSAKGGNGGGGASGAAGTPGTGGGGGGGGENGATGGLGGSGIVIVRYKRSTSLPDYAKEFSGAAGGAAVRRKGYMIHTFTSDGQFTMPCDGYVEALLVGGGGGGGKALQGANDVAGGGGGAGGVFHVASCPLSAGTYSVKVGLGGQQGENGGETRLSDATKLFDLVAYGGGGGGTAGYVATAKAPKNGASGGGATFKIDGSGTYSGGMALYLASDIVGHDGGAASHMYGAGGGGGAGATPTVHVNGDVMRAMLGGDGLSFDTCGTNAWYAGGGAGGMAYGAKANGGKGGGGASGEAGTPGTGGGGGGGGSGHPEGAPGGSGVLIIRYKLPPSGMVLIFR